MPKLKTCFRFLFTIYAIVVFILWMLLILLLVIIISLSIRHSESIIHKIMRFWGKAWFTSIGVRFKALNAPNYIPGKPYIFIANHSSYMDIPTIVLAINTPLKILGKAELTKVPIFGWICKIAVISVDRSNIKSRAGSLQLLKKMLEQGVSVLVFPEGGIIESDDVLNDFHLGVFKLSKELNIPIAPIVLFDTLARQHYNSFFSLNPGISSAKYLPIIYPENYQNANEIKIIAFDSMLKALTEYKK